MQIKVTFFKIMTLLLYTSQMLYIVSKHIVAGRGQPTVGELGKRLPDILVGHLHKDDPFW